MNGEPALQEVDASQPSLSPSNPAPEPPTHVVGIGASAGGLEALEQFFQGMPAKTGMAFVVIQHLSPDFKSLTAELLARKTGIPLFQVTDGMEITRDAIFLIPPKKDMIISNGRLLLTDKDPAQLVTLPIDHFFRSLAQDAGDRSVAVILSGTGSDGSRGIRDVHDAGGLVVVQAPDTAKFDGMPNSAVKTGTVAFTLAPEAMADALLRYIKHPLGPAAPPQPEAAEDGMAAVFRLLRDASGIDFSHYKPATVARRTDRRLLLNGSITLGEYVERLSTDPEELNALYKDLLIGVTRFFRDKEAFESLEFDILPQLLDQAQRDEEFRVWAAGCATGEEAYSLAILIQERLEALHKPLPVKIFATDVHRSSLEAAGAGVYGEANVVDLSPERLGRFFVRKNGGYQVTPELRKMVVFAQHNVLKDAPFTKLDLITCRNLLIYLQPLAQKKALSLFHFGLKTGGILFLGPSESPGELADEFDPVDAHWKIFRKRRDVRLPADVRMPPSVTATRLRVASGVNLGPGTVLDTQLLGTYDALLDQWMPPSLLVNERRELVHTFAGANRYLSLKEGRFTPDVLDMVDAELRMALTGALQRVFKERVPVAYKGLRVPGGEDGRTVNVTVKPVPSRKSGVLHALISLEEPEPAPAEETEPRQINLDEASREHVLSLEAELRYTKENLQATIEELETSNEELQATNEELVASNEELQSTNEELHSVNEELFTVNGEYQKKITELTELTADMDNLLVSTQVHTIFLDHNLCIRKFTPKIAETFSLLPQDVGRRIDSFTHTIDHPHLLADVREVLETGSPLDRQVQDHRGNWFLLRVLPYRAGQAVQGVVLTLVDINTLKRVEAEVRWKDQQLTSILQNSPNLVSIKDPDGRILLADQTFKDIVGCDPTGKTVRDLFPPETADVLEAQDRRVIAEGAGSEVEVVIPAPDGPHTYLSVKFPLHDEAGKIVGVGGIKTDVTQLKRAEREAREAVAQRDRFLAMLSHELRNPLAAIINAAGAIEGVGVGSPSAPEWVRVIDRRARHMARLLDDLLDVCRLTQNRIEVRKRVLDLATLIPDVAEEVRPWLTSGRLRLDLEEPDGPLFVEGDPARLQQIQVNLLMNAARYTPPDGRIWYSLRREGDEAVIRVRDTGAGIPPDMLEKVFGLFVQAGNTGPRSGGGIGVGLTLVRSIVELHGGRVRAYSDGPGKGSEFAVWLPLVREPVPPAPEEPHPAPPAPRGAGLEVLLIEDDADIRETLRAILEHDGYRVRAAPDGPTGLQLLEEAPPAVAVVDVGLPGMDGYEVARRVRARWGPDRVRLIALTGYGQQSDRQAARAAGFDVHLTKPLKSRELYRVLESFDEPGKNR